MAGIYLHIPFCRQACHYCDFHFSTSLQNKEAFLSALKKEIVLQRNYPGGEKIHTIYFGGGTPSLLSAEELKGVFQTLEDNFVISPDAEITLEANPDDLTAEKLASLRQTPVNRLSIGIQSFYDEDLKLMNRAHTAEEALTAVKLAQENGLQNISIDLIYGIPGLTDHRWRNNLQIAFALGIKHISAYCLTVEPKTAFAHQVRTGQVKDVNEQESAEQFNTMLEAMYANDFVQYEISNFCRDGAYSRHNSSYWKKEKYLGLGPSAHSYNGVQRQWNIANNALYIRSLENNQLNFENEELSLDQRYNEYVMTTLRTIWGLDLEVVRKEFGQEYFEHCVSWIASYIRSGCVINEENKVFLTDKGKLIADRITSDLFKTS
jgi:oxygen-independent coproporphyrinogen-3 oxidase